MKKADAKAIVLCVQKIEGALNTLLAKLDGEEREYAHNYWAWHIRRLLTSGSYGSAPLAKALETLEVE